MWLLEILDGDAAESLVIDPLNAGDGVAAGMPDPLLGGRRTEPRQIAVVAGVAKTGQLVSLLLARVPTPSAKHADERVAEGFPEVFVEVGVNQRVEGGVEVADPEEDLDDDVGTVAVLTADRDAQVPEEKREPAQDEGPHNDAQSPRSFVLSADLLQVFVFVDRRSARLVAVAPVRRSFQQSATVPGADALLRRRRRRFLSLLLLLWFDRVVFTVGLPVGF